MTSDKGTDPQCKNRSFGAYFFDLKISTYINPARTAMLYIIKKLTDPLIGYIKDDPVRPEISADFRISENAEILVLLKDDRPSAIVCVAYRDFVPKDTVELMSEPTDPFVAVFYTIWSYDAGAGRDLIRIARKELPIIYPNIKKFVTLSPQTEMAKRFHLKNGANVLSANATSVNYEYA